MKRFDWTIWLGIAVGALAIIGGAWNENLNISVLWHPSAALIVCGGTLGAVIVRRGLSGIMSALKAVWELRHRDDEDKNHNIEIAKLAWLSRSANKNGVKAYEDYAEASGDVLVAQGLTLVADRVKREQVEEVLKRRLALEYDEGMHDTATMDAAGGFAPTFGILGAVLGLISVLRVLDKPELLGVGIATAFVATIYGLSLANLIFFPLAARLRERHESRMARREQLSSVILALVGNETPQAIMSQFNLPK
ncbi:MAG: MotA/TolQ/ExbB proton channel family protein [Pyrinomonadaceae bacterium]